jgi:crotonobetainyl-CoA:carnitine CoA-transferase CaiB-like acyl-CoA transferase
MYDLLKGYRVLECALLLNGGQVGMFFADLGAEVIKVEDPVRGDYLRDILGQVRPHESPSHLQVHKNKKSVALDLNDARGREIFFELLKTADVFIDGLRGGVCDRMGIGYDVQRTVKPDIVYVQCTGYGATGPYANIPTHGYQMKALPGGVPAKKMPDGRVERAHGVQYMAGVEESSPASILAAQAATMTTFAALVRRERTGEGAYIDVAASDAVLATAWQGVIYNVNYDRITDFKTITRKQESYVAKWPNDSARYQLYSTADDRFVLIGVIEKKFWDPFCRVAGREDLIDTLRPGQQMDYGEDKPWLRAEVQKMIGAKTLAEWMEIAAEVGLPIGPAHGIDDVAGDPHMQARGRLVETNDPELGPFTYVAFPALIRGQEYGEPERAPRHGEDTAEYLKEVGVTPEEVEALTRKGVAHQWSRAAEPA